MCCQAVRKSPGSNLNGYPVGHWPQYIQVALIIYIVRSQSVQTFFWAMAAIAMNGNTTSDVDKAEELKAAANAAFQGKYVARDPVQLLMHLVPCKDFVFFENLDVVKRVCGIFRN
jgi:hypothetical protein